MGGKKKTVEFQSHSLNKFMHPRNPYKTYPSFKQLAILYPEFRAHCTYDFRGKIVFDFKNPEALRVLAICLMDKDFGLKLKIPENRLVPTLPLRLNYLLWIEDLLSLTNKKGNQSGKPPIGIDIGTGAACVYPLLGAIKFGWKFVATEMDELSFQSAIENIKNNNLQNSIFLHKSSDFFDVLKEENINEFTLNHQKNILPMETSESCEKGSNFTSKSVNGKEQGCHLIDFTMCNPPFFSSEEEMNLGRSGKRDTRSKPNSISTGMDHEKITEGGEVAFIGKMIESSLHHKKTIRIFSTLIGKKNDVKAVVNLIKEKSGGSFVRISNTEFCQGRTMRWGVAWTFHQDIPLEQVLSKKQKLSKKPLVIPVPRSRMTSYNVLSVWPLFESWLNNIKIKPNIVKKTKFIIVAMIRAYKPTWLHQRQKRRQKDRQSNKCQNTDAKEGDAMETMASEETDLPHKRKADESGERSSPKRLKESEQFENLSLNSNSLANSCEAETGSSSNGQPTKALLDTKKAVAVEDGSNILPEKKSKGGLECLLKCSLCLKQTENLIALEMNFIGGVGKKESMHQLYQYLNNRLYNDEGEGDY